MGPHYEGAVDGKKEEVDNETTLQKLVLAKSRGNAMLTSLETAEPIARKRKTEPADRTPKKRITGETKG